MRTLENMGSTYIIPGEVGTEVETADEYIDYDFGIGNLERKPEENKYTEEALKKVKSRNIGRKAILAAGAFDVS